LEGGRPPQKGAVDIALAAAALFSGAALVVTVIWKISLAITYLCLGVSAGTAALYRWRRTSASRRPILRAFVATGVRAGLIATLAYDASRLLLVWVGGFRVGPFDAFPLFGYLLAGTGIARWLAVAIGTAYHYANGAFFSVAYCLVWGGRPWWYGVVWGLALELAMLSVYPSWLNLRGLMPEFTVMSLSGHLVYGATLGALSRRWLARFRRPPSASASQASLSRGIGRRL
jgi:hypothetical protein